MKPLIYFVAFFSFLSTVWANEPVPECRAKPEFFSHGKVLSSVKDLPKVVLIGKRAIYYVENKSTGFRLVGEQSFVKGQSQIVCATMPEATPQSFSIYAPTLIDLTGDQSTGDSYWQFHMIANAKQFGIWNKQSRVFSKSKDLESGLAKTGAQIQVVQISRDQFEIQFSRELDKTNEVLSIRFDALSQIP
jgi:hypothetical protein